MAEVDPEVEMEVDPKEFNNQAVVDQLLPA
jgi:hypothetical protein